MNLFKVTEDVCVNLDVWEFSHHNEVDEYVLWVAKSHTGETTELCCLLKKEATKDFFDRLVKCQTRDLVCPVCEVTYLGESKPE
jgi:hypothetical protein